MPGFDNTHEALQLQVEGVLKGVSVRIAFDVGGGSCDSITKGARDGSCGFRVAKTAPVSEFLLKARVSTTPSAINRSTVSSMIGARHTSMRSLANVACPRESWCRKPIYAFRL